MGPYFNSRDKHYKDPFGAVPCGAEVRFAVSYTHLTLPTTPYV